MPAPQTSDATAEARCTLTLELDAADLAAVDRFIVARDAFLANPGTLEATRAALVAATPVAHMMVTAVLIARMVERATFGDVVAMAPPK